MKTEHLQNCQVETPHEIVDLVWKLACAKRENRRFSSVVDFGAGDARFAKNSSAYDEYTGVEMDKIKVAGLRLPEKAKVVIADAMVWKGAGFDLCIGNPPYIRHHHLDPKWRADVLHRITLESGVKLKQSGNVFVLFLMQALLRTHNNGLVVQVIPFEWVSRPSASPLRDYIDQNKWDVTVYRFNTDIFPRVLTTASVTVIDKSSRNSKWSFAEIGKDGKTKEFEQPSGHAIEVLSYENRRGSLFGLRGLSPGGQDIFVLTEEERLQFSLKKKRDVVPCVTSLRAVPSDLRELDVDTFNRYFVTASKRCWLIRSDLENISSELRFYLDSVGDRWKRYSTCTVRKIWWLYRPHPKPAMLIASGFVGKTPKLLVNTIGAIAVGSVYGIVSTEKKLPEQVAEKLWAFDFEQCVVSHSNNLKKVEVRQLNTVLAQLNS